MQKRRLLVIFSLWTIRLLICDYFLVCWSNRATRCAWHPTALALKSAQAVAPDLFLLDIKMPGMNGYEVCEQLKADPRTRDIPVIFISALDQTEDKVKAFTSGGVDYVTKPIQLEEVLARVETHLALRQLHRRLQAANAELAQRLEELEIRNQELQTALSTIKTLSGLQTNPFFYVTIIKDNNDAPKLRLLITLTLGFTTGYFYMRLCHSLCLMI